MHPAERDHHHLQQMMLKCVPMLSGQVHSLLVMNPTAASSRWTHSLHQHSFRVSSVYKNCPTCFHDVFLISRFYLTGFITSARTTVSMAVFSNSFRQLHLSRCCSQRAAYWTLFDKLTCPWSSDQSCNAGTYPVRNQFWLGATHNTRFQRSSFKTQIS